MMHDVFGHLPDGRAPDGGAVERVRLRSRTLTAHVLTLGAIVQDLRLDGVAHPLVLGADSLTPYLGPMNWFGSTVGRFANRIAHGACTIDGQDVQLSKNFRGRHCLHGGERGSAERLWTITGSGTDRVSLSLVMPDGDMGFPGALNVALTITLDDNALDFDIRATSDRSTICSFSHHGYFILDDSGSLAQHRLRIAAEHYLPVDDDLIPTGEIAPVADTSFDFRTPRSLRDVALDHNFCLSSQRTRLRPVAWLDSAASDIAMQVETTDPGLQVYTAFHLPQNGVEGLGGRRYGRHAGIALEAQAWPDAPNRPAFPSAILRPDATYHHRTRYVFRSAPERS